MAVTVLKNVNTINPAEGGMSSSSQTTQQKLMNGRRVVTESGGSALAGRPSELDGLSSRSSLSVASNSRTYTSSAVMRDPAVSSPGGQRSADDVMAQRRAMEMRARIEDSDPAADLQKMEAEAKKNMEAGKRLNQANYDPGAVQRLKMQA